MADNTNRRPTDLNGITFGPWTKSGEQNRAERAKRGDLKQNLKGFEGSYTTEQSAGSKRETSTEIN